MTNIYIDVRMTKNFVMDTIQRSKIFKALGDSTRMQIFDMLRDGELCACKILEKFDITQPTLSHHMKILCDSGLVVARKDWKWMYYSLNCQAVCEIAEFLGDVKCRRQ